MHNLRQTGVCACRTAFAGKRILQVVLVLLTLSGTLAWGQAQNTGSIFGNVVDPSGASIVGATVEVTDSGKGFSRSVTTSKSGEFTLPSLPVGAYVVTVTATGFQTSVIEAVTVDADKSVKLVPKMVVGDKGETVTVEGEGATLDTRSATVGTMLDNKLVEGLPIDGNNVVALAGLLPGVTDLNAPATNTSDRGGPTYSVSGSRNTQNLMLFDGLMWNNLFFNTGINFPPSQGLQEISVLLNNFKAQYGRNAGSVFNVLTKSGGNKMHGVVWDYFQNRYFNAADYLTHVNPKDNSNQFGVSVTGPIKRDKIFYNLTYGGLIQRLEAVGTVNNQNYAERGFLPNAAPAFGTTLKNVPYSRPCSSPGPYAGMGLTCASYLDEIAGVQNGVQTYSKLLNPEKISSSAGNAAVPQDAENMFNSAWVQDGHTGQNPCLALLQQAAQYAGTHTYYDGAIRDQYMPNAEFPTACLNPVMSRVLAAYSPYPNILQTSPSSLSGFVSAAQSSAPQPRASQNLLARVDWMATTRHTIDARYNLLRASDTTSPGVTSASIGVPTYVLQANVANSNFGNIADTWVVSPTVLNVLRVGYKRYVLAGPPQDHRTLADFGGNFLEAGVPVMPVISASGQYTLGSSSQANANVVNENIEVLEQASWQKGKHSLQFGVNFLRLQYLNVTDYPGQLSFSSTFTGVSLADEALGLVNQMKAASPLVQGGVNHSIFTYAQDDWRATSKLTLNLGVRYELPFQWYQPNGYSSTFIPGHQSTVFPNAIAGLAFPGDPGVLNSLVPTDFNGLVPRLGMAYDVYGTGKFLLRAGFGMFFDAINANVIGVGEPFYYQIQTNLPPGGASAPLAGLGPNGSTLVLPTGFNKANPQFAAPYTLFFPDRNFRTPYYEAMNIGFQTRITRSGVLDVNYIAKLGRKLTIPIDMNPAIYDCAGGYFQADKEKYCTGASSSQASTRARARYTPFLTGGTGLVNFTSTGTSNYNGLQAQYTQRGGKLLTLLMSYSYSKAIDLQTQSQGTSSQIPNVFDLSSERGVSDYDARHVFNMGWLLTPPKIRNGNGIVKGVLNNWTYGGKFLTHSGRPYNITINNDSALVGEPNQRAAIRPGFSPYLPSNRHRIDKVRQYFNRDAFTYPTIGTFSNVRRNSFVGPGYIQTDMNLARQFPLAGIREGMRFVFRIEAFNVFNTPNLANPKASFSCSSTSISQTGDKNFGKGCTDLIGTPAAPIGSLPPTFGTIQSTFGNNANTSTNGRKMQFSGSVYF